MKRSFPTLSRCYIELYRSGIAELRNIPGDTPMSDHFADVKTSLSMASTLVARLEHLAESNCGILI